MAAGGDIFMQEPVFTGKIPERSLPVSRHGNEDKNRDGDEIPSCSDGATTPEEAFHLAGNQGYFCLTKTFTAMYNTS
ncbi:MAG: hypothetical protein LBB90_12465 [Tannerella sp.]|nr:hypothetical protein [Tannerella sp.]